MKHIRLIEILKTFDEDELKALEKFLYSPFIKSRRNIGDLLKYVKKFHPEYSVSEISREKIFKALYPEEEYNYKKLENLIFDLTKETERYLSFAELQEDEIDEMMYLSKAFYKRNLIEHSMRTCKAIESKLDPGFSRSKNYFERIKKLESIKEYYFSQKQENSLAARSQNKIYETSAIQFLVNYTSLMVEKFYEPYRANAKGKMSLSEQLSKCFNAEKFMNLTLSKLTAYSSIILLHQLILKTISEPAVLAHYYSLKTFFIKNIKYFDREEKYFVFTHLLNYVESKMLEGRKDLYQEYSHMTFAMFECEAYTSSEKEFLHINDYLNVMQLPLSKEERIFNIRKCINHLIKKLKPEEREDARNYSLAYMYTSDSKHEKSLEALSKFKSFSGIYKWDCRFTQMENYYELGFFEEAISAAASLKKFVRSNKELTERGKNNYYKLAEYYLALVKVKVGQSKEGPEFLLKKLESPSEMMPMKSWIISKLEELSYTISSSIK